jgi:hypothetical protein
MNALHAHRKNKDYPHLLIAPARTRTDPAAPTAGELRVRREDTGWVALSGTDALHAAQKAKAALLPAELAEQPFTAD